MKCERCGKDDAVVKITRVERTGRAHQISLCQSCAAEQSPYQKKFLEKQASFDLILKHLLAQQKVQVSDEESASIAVDPCPTCGLDFAIYRATCMLGCPDCYEAFSQLLEADLEKVQRATRHVTTSAPAKSDLAVLQEQLHAMREEMKTSIEYEDYERAAFLRDEIERLEAEASSTRESHEDIPTEENRP